MCLWVIIWFKWHFNILASCNIWISLSITAEVPLTWWAIDTDPHQSAWEQEKKKQIWVTYLHNNVGLSMKHLRSGANRACVACVFPPPSSLRRLKTDILCYLFISRLPVNSSFCQCRGSTALCIPSMLLTLASSAHARWIEVRWGQHFGPSRLQLLNLYREIPRAQDEMRISSVLIRCEHCILRCFNFWVEPQNKRLY